MKKLVISFSLLILLAASSQAQGLYRVTYGTNGITYEGLLAWYGTGQPYMRVRFYHPTLKRYLLVKQNVSFVPNGYLSYFLTGSNAEYLTSVPSGYSYAPDTFIFERYANGYFYCTRLVDAANQSGSVSEFRPLMPHEVTSTLLQNFGFTYTSSSPPASSPSSVTLHLIVVADTEDRDIGAASRADIKGLRKEFEVAAKEAGITFSPTIISGSGFSKITVVNTLNNLNPGSNDVVVFVYTGHGFRFNDDTDAYPRFSLTRNRQSPILNNLSTSEVYRTLRRKGARLNITIADTCNGNIGFNKPNHDEGLQLKPSDAGISRRAITTLLLNARGNIVGAAATRGEYALSNARIGGFFIHSFLNAFMYETSIANTGTPSWQRIMSNSKRYAYDKTSGRQTAVFYTDVR